MKPISEMTHIITYEDMGKPFIYLKDIEDLIKEVEHYKVMKESCDILNEVKKQFMEADFCSG